MNNRIFTPSEYDRLIQAIVRNRNRIVISTLLNTGMRYKELRGFSAHSEWLDIKNRTISLPGAITKTGESRVIHITHTFALELGQYLKEYKKLIVPTRDGMNKNLRTWARQAQLEFVPSAKTFRKTWESWLLAADYPYMKVCLSQGHSPQISYAHYANLPPELKSEMPEVEAKTAGWGI